MLQQYAGHLAVVVETAVIRELLNLNTMEYSEKYTYSIKLLNKSDQMPMLGETSTSRHNHEELLQITKDEDDAL